MFNNSPFVSPFPKLPYGTTTQIQKKVEGKSRKYLNFAADNGGCMWWRIGWPELHVNMNSLGESASLTKMILHKEWYRDVDVIKLQRQASSNQKEFISFLKSIQGECGFKLMYEVDDVVFHEEIPDFNIYKETFANDEIRQNCIDMINMVDEVTVTCKYMRDLYIEKTGKKEITVVPNFPPEWWIGNTYNYQNVINNYDKNKRKPRIVYSGSGAHFDVSNKTGQQDDFSHVIKFIVDNRTKYQFVFIGAFPPPLKPFIDSKEIEFHPWQSLMKYPKFLESLDAQLFLAPLMDIPFNRSKSDIKYIEASTMGIPCMVQNMVTYEDAPDFLKFDNSDDLAEKVENLLDWKNRSKYYKLVPALRKLGESRFLERPENIGCFLESLNTPFGDPSRKFLRSWN
jgi:hypothetical protein